MTDYTKRTMDQILDDVRTGNLDMGELKLREEVRVEKFDVSGQERALIETRTVVAVDGQVIEHTIHKH